MMTKLQLFITDINNFYWLIGNIDDDKSGYIANGNFIMDITIRKINIEDHYNIECMTKRAFWNLNMEKKVLPGQWR